MPDLQSILDSALNDPKGISPNAAQLLTPVAPPPVTPLPNTPIQPVNGYQVAARSGVEVDPVLTQEEIDVHTLTPYQLEQKYGMEGAHVLRSNLAAGLLKYNQDISTNRDPGALAWDAVTGTLGLTASGLLGITGMGAGLVDPNTGAKIAGAANDLTKFVEDNQSSGLKAHRVAGQAREQEYALADQAAHEEDLKTQGKFEAKISNFGRTLIHSVVSAAQDPTLLEEGTVDNAGAILVNYALTSGLGALAEAVAPGAKAAGEVSVMAGKAGPLSEAGTARAAFLRRAATITPKVSQGVQMGGMAYQSAAGQIMDQSFDDLQHNSQVYRDALAAGMSPEEARLHAAGIAGRQAALIAAPLAAATASISHLSEHPFEAGSLPEMVSTVGKQTVEGALVNVTQKGAENYALDKPLDEGMGKAFGEGAVYGLTAAAGMQGVGAGPKLALESIFKTGDVAAKMTSRAVKSFADGAAKRAADKENLKATQEVIDGANAIVENAPEVAAKIEPDLAEVSPEVRSKVEDYVNGFHEALAFDPAKEITNPNAPADLVDSLSGSRNRIEAIDKIAQRIPEETDAGKKAELASTMFDLMAPLDKFRRIDEKTLSELPQDGPVRDLLHAYTAIANNAEHMLNVVVASEDVHKYYASRAAETKTISEDALKTHDGMSQVEDTITRARVAPETGSPEIIDSVLAHADNGRIQLTDTQRQALEASKTILTEQKKLIDAKKANGTALQPFTPDSVKEQILTGRDKERADKTPSAVQFYSKIYNAVRSGDLEAAKNTLADMGQFVQHTKNKAEAFNQHLVNPEQYPNGAPYLALSPREKNAAPASRRWYVSTENFKNTKAEVDPFVKPTSAGSVAHARNVFAEHEALTNVYNGLVDTFPQLGESKIAPAQIHPAIAGESPDRIAQGFKLGTRKVADFAEEHKAQQEAVRTQQEQFSKQAPKESIVAKSVADAAKPIPAPEPVVDQPAAEPNAQPVAVKSPEPATVSEPAPVIEESRPETVAPATEPVKAPAQEAMPTPEPATEKPTAVTEPTTVEPPKTTEAGPVQETVPPTEPAEPATPTEPVDSAASDLPGYFDPTSSVGSKEEKPSALKAIFSKLVEIPGKLANKFHDSFSLRRGQSEPLPTRTVDSTSPANEIRYALQPETFKQFVNSANLKKTLTTEVARAYQNVLKHVEDPEAQKEIYRALRAGKQISDEQRAKLGNLGGMLLVMHANLARFLDEPYDKKKDPRTMRELFAAGDEKAINRMARGKVLNITEPYKDTFIYNQNLMEHAALAGMHWFLNVGFAAPTVTDEAIEKILKTDLNSLPEGAAETARELFKKSYAMEEAKDGITNAIRQFWPVKSLSSADKAYSDGIPEAMAAEVMRAMKEVGFFSEKLERIPLGLDDNGEMKFRSYIRFEPANLRENPTFKAIREYPGAIADAVVIHPEQVTHLGDDAKLRVPTHQMNSDTRNTEKQKAAIDAANQTKHALNLPLLNLYAKLGRDALLDMFGGGANPDEQHTNVVDLKTRQGKNLTISQAHDHLIDLVSQMENRSLTTGEALHEIEIHYEHNMSRVGRLQMLGANNPQANKLTREVILPTWATLDLSKDGEHKLAFDLATAQALGEKVETMEPETAAARAQELMQGPLAPVMDLLRQHIREGDAAERLYGNPNTTVENAKFGRQLHEAFVQSGIEEKPVALHALFEQARLLESTPEQKASFYTGLYLEADGKTNGPMNAMGMLGNGTFEPNWVANIKKGGFTFSDEAQPLHSLDKVDLYETAARHTEYFARELNRTFAQTKDVKGVSDALIDLMHDFLPGLQRKGDSFELNRKIAKNPLTIALYGSGLRGIAGKVAGDLLENIYGRMTEAAQRKGTSDMPWSQAMFPESTDHIEKLDSLIQNLNTVFGAEIRQNSETGEFYSIVNGLRHPLLNGRDFNPVAFEAKPEHLKALSNNMHEVLVKPLMAGIGATVGEDVMNASKLLQVSTNKQSIVYSNFINNEVRKAIADRAKNDPTYRPGDFLSQDKFDEIVKSAAPLAPLAMNGDEQAVMMTKAASYTDNKLKYNRALDGRYGTSPDVPIPGAAGVAGMPFSIISHGDGHMIQRILQLLGKGAPVLPVFDGLHMPLDRIREYSKIANQAAMEAWGNNPVGSVRDAYRGMLDNADMIHQTLADQYAAAHQLYDSLKGTKEEISLHDAMKQTMTLAQEVIKTWNDGSTIFDFRNATELHDAVIKSLHGEGDMLNQFAASIDARHEVLKQVGLSADQMASAATPYHNGGTLPIDTSDATTIQADLNKLLAPAEVKAREALPKMAEPRSHADYLKKDWKEPGDISLDHELETKNVPEIHQENGIDRTVEEATPQSMTQPIRKLEVPASKERAAFKNTTGKFGREDKQTGVRILSKTSLRQLANSLDLSKEQRNVLSEIFRAEGTKDFEIVTGTKEQIADYADRVGSAAYRDMAGQDGLLHGFVSLGERRVYLIDPTPETLTHELIHASTYQTVYSHFNGEQLHPEVHAAINRLVDLKNSFMNGDFGNHPAVLSARAAIDGAKFTFEGSEAKQQADSLNEFMAWTLANRDLAAKLQANKEGFAEKGQEQPLLFPEKEMSVFKKWTVLAKNVVDQIKTIFWKGNRAPAVGKDMFSNIRFNTGIVMREPVRVSKILADSALAHRELDGDQHQAAIRDALRKTVVDHIDAMPTKTAEQRVDQIAAREYHRLAEINNEVAKKMRSFFPLSMNEATNFNVISAALQTHAHLDPSFLNRATELYNHVIKNVTAQDFIDPTDHDQLRAEHNANAKYNVLVGREGDTLRYDRQGLSNILPSFVALAMVDKGFRDVLSKIDMPKAKASDASSTADRVLENLGNSFMDKMGSIISGDLKAKNVREAIDALSDRIIEHAYDEKNWLQIMAGKLGAVSDYFNDKLVNALGYVSDRGIEASEKMRTSQSEFAQKAAGLVTLLSGAISNKNADIAAESLLKTVNLFGDAPVANAVKKFVVDLVGRTEANAPVVDMIKQVRSMVAQLRQNYREQVPKILAKKFSTPLDEETKSHLFYGLGKSDLASFMENHSVEDTLKLLADPHFRAAKARELEYAIQSEDPANFELYGHKMNQLAEKMMTDRNSENLLRNANSIAKLHGYRLENKPVLSENAVRAIDQLTTLKALDKLAPKQQEALSSLVQNEAEGTKFLAQYMHAQRQFELTKVKGDGLLENTHWKGYIPSQQELGSSLRVAPDSAAGDLKLRGYVKVGKYEGSKIEDGKEPKSYWFSPLSGQTAFAQGVIQNVDHTASGVDAVTGYSKFQTAGRIIDPTQVSRYAGRMLARAEYLRKSGRADDQTEHLLPLYDEAGNVYAFERALKPEMLAMRNPSTDIFDMAGVWRGRQIEEGLSKEINHALVDRAFQMYLDESNAGRAGGSRTNEYVNVLDPKQTSKVQQDAVRLFNQDTKDYLEEKFGKGTFMVRKDLIDDVIGYRHASIGDAWTGASNWSPETQAAVRDTMVRILGTDAYRKLVGAERTVQGFMADVRRNIAVKSLIVPAQRVADNVVQLMSRGVPITAIAKGTALKMHEIHLYNQARQREVEIEAELHAAANDPVRATKLAAELQTIRDSYQRMSIAPLLNHGEFSTIAGVGDSAEDLKLSSGRVSEWLESKIKDLPPALQTPARYGIVARDTALFQGLERLAEYSDFVAKGILYDDMTKRRGLSQKEALAAVTEEYVNFDRLPGRSRSYTDNMGLTWFLNYKIRVAKVALNMLRNNPFHALVASTLPGLNEAGNVFKDNVIAKTLDGGIRHSLGPQVAMYGISPFGPWMNLIH